MMTQLMEQIPEQENPPINPWRPWDVLRVTALNYLQEASTAFSNTLFVERSTTVPYFLSISSKERGTGQQEAYEQMEEIIRYAREFGARDRDIVMALAAY